MMSIGHGAAGAPTNLTGGAALGGVNVPSSQHKLDKLAEKLAMKKTEEPAPTKEKQPLDWDTLIGEKLDRFSQLLRSEIVGLKLKKLKDKISK